MKRLRTMAIFCAVFLLTPVLQAKTVTKKQTENSFWKELTKRVQVMGRFDVNFEWVNPTKRDIDKKDFKNYHHFLMIRVTPMKNLVFFAEVIDQYFYEMRWTIHERVRLKVGKIMVPFGGDEYHHWYGGLAGDPTKGLLLPMVWAELGGGFEFDLSYLKWFGVTMDLYAIQGFAAKDFESTLNLNNGSSGDVVAMGARFKFKFGPNIRLYASFLWNQYLKGHNMFAYGLDLVLDYNMIPVKVLRDFKVTLGAARVDIQNQLQGWYYKYGDYIQLEWGTFRQWFLLRLRYGTYIDHSDILTNRDSHNFTISFIVTALKYVRVMFQHNFRLEEVDEIDNDFFRIQVALEF